MEEPPPYANTRKLITEAELQEAIGALHATTNELSKVLEKLGRFDLLVPMLKAEIGMLEAKIIQDRRVFGINKP